MERNGAQFREQAAQDGFFELRAARPHGAQVLCKRSARTQCATDLAIQIDPVREGDVSGQRCPSNRRRAIHRFLTGGTKGAKQLHRSTGIQTHQADVQHGPAICANRASLRLPRHVRFLEVDADGAIAVGTEYAVTRGLVGRHPGAECRNPRPDGAKLGAIEKNERVSGGDHDLSLASWTGGKAKKTRDQPVEQSWREGGFRVSGDRDEDLAARRVGRQAPRVASRMHD